jgi:hypothetical protein
VNTLSLKMTPMLCISNCTCWAAGAGRKGKDNLAAPTTNLLPVFTAQQNFFMLKQSCGANQHHLRCASVRNHNESPGEQQDDDWVNNLTWATCHSSQRWWPLLKATYPPAHLGVGQAATVAGGCGDLCKIAWG